MPTRYYINFIIGAICLAKAIQALYSGEISMRISRTRTYLGQLSYRKNESPVLYWLLVIFCFAAAALIFALPFIVKPQ